MKEIKWFKSDRILNPMAAYEDDIKAREIAKKDNCIVRLIWEDNERMVSNTNEKCSIIRSITRYKEFEYVNDNFEIREGIL